MFSPFSICAWTPVATDRHASKHGLGNFRRIRHCAVGVAYIWINLVPKDPYICPSLPWAQRPSPGGPTGSQGRCHATGGGADRPKHARGVEITSCMLGFHSGQAHLTKMRQHCVQAFVATHFVFDLAHTRYRVGWWPGHWANPVTLKQPHICLKVLGAQFPLVLVLALSTLCETYSFQTCTLGVGVGCQVFDGGYMQICFATVLDNILLLRGHTAPHTKACPRASGGTCRSVHKVFRRHFLSYMKLPVWLGSLTAVGTPGLKFWVQIHAFVHAFFKLWKFIKVWNGLPRTRPRISGKKPTFQGLLHFLQLLVLRWSN